FGRSWVRLFSISVVLAVFAACALVFCILPLLCARHLARGTLHSFPTRRSSDLDGNRADNGLDQQRRGSLRNSRSPGAGIAELRRDRKSTRLNSSHDQISYAVFCLKKKNPTIRRVRRRRRYFGRGLLQER